MNCICTSIDKTIVTRYKEYFNYCLHQIIVEKTKSYSNLLKTVSLIDKWNYMYIMEKSTK